MFLSNVKFYVKSTITSSQGTGTTFLISPDFEQGNDISTGGDTASIVLKNGTQIERLECTISAGTATIVLRGLTQGPIKTASSGLQKQWTEGTVGYITALSSDLMDVDKSSGTQTISSPTTFTGKTSFSAETDAPYFATTGARDAAIPSPANGSFCNVLGTLYIWNNTTVQWEAAGVSTPVPFASETVAGRVEIGTQVETDAGTETGGTGAILSVTPRTFQQGITNKIADSATVITGTDNTKIVTPAGLTSKIASDAEALAGTVTNKIITPAQLHASINNSIQAPLTKNFATDYQATINGFVVARATRNVTGSNNIMGYIGATSPASTLIASNSSDTYSGATESGVCFPVPKGYYYRVEGSGNSSSMYFMPMQ